MDAGVSASLGLLVGPRKRIEPLRRPQTTPHHTSGSSNVTARLSGVEKPDSYSGEWPRREKREASRGAASCREGELPGEPPKSGGGLWLVDRRREEARCAEGGWLT